MTFDSPQILWLLAALPVLGGLGYIRGLSGYRSVSRLIGSGNGDTDLGRLIVRRFVTDLLLLLALGCGIGALAGPRWGETSVEDDRQGLEIVFLMDVSNSMLAQDIVPSRLGRSRDVARSVAARISDGLFSVVAFKGDGTVIVPMTEDVNSFETALKYLGPGFVSAPGTNLALGLERALTAFPSGSPRIPVIIVFSDGQQQDGALGTVLRKLRDTDVTVLSVVAGTANPVTIPVADGGVLRDSRGQPVLVGVDESALRELAAMSRGEVFQLADPAVVQSLIKTLQDLAGGTGPRFRIRSVPRYRVFLLLMLLFLALRTVVEAQPEERRR